MTSKAEKKRRASLVEAMVAEDTKRAIEEMPISFPHLGQLFDHLDVELENGCDHTARYTKSYLSKEKLEIDKILPWLQNQGGGCDCEILANVEESWESEISKHS